MVHARSICFKNATKTPRSNGRMREGRHSLARAGRLTPYIIGVYPSLPPVHALAEQPPAEVQRDQTPERPERRLPLVSRRSSATGTRCDAAGDDRGPRGYRPGRAGMVARAATERRRCSRGPPRRRGTHSAGVSKGPGGYWRRSARSSDHHGCCGPCLGPVRHTRLRPPPPGPLDSASPLDDGGPDRQVRAARRVQYLYKGRTRPKHGVLTRSYRPPGRGTPTFCTCSGRDTPTFCTGLLLPRSYFATSRNACASFPPSGFSGFRSARFTVSTETPSTAAATGAVSPRASRQVRSPAPSPGRGSRTGRS